MSRLSEESVFYLSTCISEDLNRHRCRFDCSFQLVFNDTGCKFIWLSQHLLEIGVIPKELIAIQDFLSNRSMPLSRPFRDGRNNALVNEREIIDSIAENFAIERARGRHWYHFAIDRGGDKIPVSLKVTSTSTADNIQCKLGMYYALTGIWPSFANEINWEDYFTRLKQDIGRKKDKDYYILVVNKEDYKDVFCTSLKQLQTLVANGNNLPFQCNWGNNRALQ